MFDVVGLGANSVDDVYRLPGFPVPDSPTAKLRITQHSRSAGGQTATVLCTCAAMGLRTRYVGAIGNDAGGRLIRDTLARRGVDLAHVVSREAPNAFAVILLHDTHGERVVLWDRDASLALAPGEVPPEIITGTRLLHVDDVDVEASIRAAGIARAAGIPVTSDIERVDTGTEALIAAVTIPIFAEHVLETLTGEPDFERALRAVKSRLKAAPTYAVVTLGARGAMLLDGDTLHCEPGLPVDVVDSTGAGDVFRGAFITALLRGDTPAEILRFANAAAAISCTRQGAIAGAPTLEETETLLRS
jgi:sugar/nucleoside kinase (ribokinase family)